VPPFPPFVDALLPPFFPFWSCSKSADQLLPLGVVLREVIPRALRLAFPHLGRVILRVSPCASSHASTFSAMRGCKSDHFDARFRLTTFGHSSQTPSICCEQFRHVQKSWRLQIKLQMSPRWLLRHNLPLFLAWLTMPPIRATIFAIIGRIRALNYAFRTTVLASNP
jgi:hypothetical protein